MNSTPRPPTVNNYLETQQQFTEVINTKSANFIGRDFVFTAINSFLHRYNRGYFTIIGSPGSGKSAMLAKYVQENSPKNYQVIYYNAELEGKNHVEEFLTYICCQIIAKFPNLSLANLPDNAAEGSWFLSLLLQQISDYLKSNQGSQTYQKLIIVIDGLNCIKRNLQPAGTNIFYLPRYLPQGVYFLLSRRPFVTTNSGLLIEAPMQSLNLADYPEENKQDIQTYMQTTLNSQNFFRVLADFNFWLKHKVKEKTNDFNNFKYVSAILTAISENFYTQPEQIEISLPPELATDCQQHLEKILDVENQDFAVEVLQCLAQQTQPISVTEIANLLDADEFDVEEILENWFEFLQVEIINQIKAYKLYDQYFRQWLREFLKTRRSKM
ncbi:MAG: ATP-binding protein [Sphaerospermopsis sp. SIO1G1]|nr:ATP-binding protein [Sphaerospermopsis sp. SIO1G1]